MIICAFVIILLIAFIASHLPSSNNDQQIIPAHKPTVNPIMNLSSSPTAVATKASDNNDLLAEFKTPPTRTKPIANKPTSLIRLVMPPIKSLKITCRQPAITGCYNVTAR